MEGPAVDRKDNEHGCACGGAPIVEIGGHGEALDETAGVGEGVESEGDNSDDGCLKSTQPDIASIDCVKMLCQQRTDDEEGCIVKGESGVDGRGAAGEVNRA